MSEEQNDMYAVFAESGKHERPLIMMNLSFPELMMGIIIPYENKRPFFIDGVSVNKEEIKKLKILLQKAHFGSIIGFLHHAMTRGEVARQKIYGDQYYIRIEAAMRDGCVDITSQVITAYKEKIKISVKKEDIGEYMRLIPAALDFLNTTLKLFGIKN